ncbi:cytochrome P450 4C1-like [Centruroides vittatus]|uniref:cytochrome P450 4C1-like n=1 Tax=Centruroides vittatus TaxID=120091 RepID=UPI0035106461
MVVFNVERVYEWKLVIGFAIFLSIVYIWKKKSRNKSANEIPQLSSWAYVWNLIFCPVKAQDFRKLCGKFIIQLLGAVCIATLKEKVAKVSWGGYQYFVLCHPESAQEVLKSYTVINKDWIYNILHPWLGTGLLTSSNDKWRNRRKLLTPAFHFRILEDFQGIFNDQSNMLIEKLKKKEENEEFLIDELITVCTLDIIGDSAMGVHINAQDRSDTDYVIAINEITSAVIQWFTKPWYWFSPIFNLSPLGKKFHKDIETVHEFDRKRMETIQVIREKKQKLIEELEDNQTLDNFQVEKEVVGVKKRRAFLDLLLYHHLTDGSLDEEDIREEVDTFMFEGHDTTAMGISWSLYLLGLHPDIQEKVYQELQEIFGENTNKSITSEELKRMKYLECIIKETLRIYPPVPLIVRKNPSDIKVGDYILPANSSLIINIYGIHHNPTVFENPEVFDPDRFLPEHCEKRHPFAFVPFSAGPRNCIGQRFAMMEMKTVLANVLRHFRVKSLDHRDKIFESGDVILRPKFGIRMIIKRR